MLLRPIRSLWLWFIGSTNDDWCNIVFKERVRGYIEIAVVSLLFFAYAAGIAAAIMVIWTRLVDQVLNWQIALSAGIVGLVPYFVVAAGIWRVNLNLFGNRISAEPIPPAREVAAPPGPEI